MPALGGREDKIDFLSDIPSVLAHLTLKLEPICHFTEFTEALTFTESFHACWCIEWLNAIGVSSPRCSLKLESLWPKASMMVKYVSQFAVLLRMASSDRKLCALNINRFCKIYHLCNTFAGIT